MFEACLRGNLRLFRDSSHSRTLEQDTQLHLFWWWDSNTGLYIRPASLLTFEYFSIQNKTMLVLFSTILFYTLTCTALSKKPKHYLMPLMKNPQQSLEDVLRLLKQTQVFQHFRCTLARRRHKSSAGWKVMLPPSGG